MGKRKGKALKKNHVFDESESPETLNAPHSFVIHRGLPFPNITYLTMDFRRMMEPFTASSLRERRNNKIKDFVSLSGVFHVSHMIVFNKSANQLSFKGPTLSYKIHQFTLARDVLASMKKQYFNDIAFKHAPLVILNNFTGEGNHLKLMANTFQNLFPTINLPTVNLSTIKRCVLFSYNSVTNLVDMRHYSVSVVPVGLNRSVKKVIMGKVPNLSKCEDIADFIEQSGNASESEYEDDENNEVVLPQTLSSRGNLENNKSAIRLHEIGPRLTIELIKIQNDLFTGEVLYHNSIVKTEEEIAELKKVREEKKRLKERRKKIQNENVAKKEQQKGEHKKRSISGAVKSEQVNEEEHVDNDADYYREAVGEEPDEELFHAPNTTGGRKRAFVPKQMKYGKDKDAKRRKVDADDSKSSHKGPKKFNKTDDKKQKQDFKGKGGEKKFGGKNNQPAADKSNTKKKPKPKKAKGKKKTNRNRNK
ncbi:protein Peter pan-like [Sitodiplosis mosellana]|uniref:protein Peter pan-like n=1 Tax=Sitodiplosis mosellana TaxID=263140 RepID=UPI002443A763|nr:protein Peter pan-like [Sitodiplosis mosellana]